MILTVLGWLLKALLVLLVVLLLAPVVVGVQLREGKLNVWVRILFARLTFYPIKPMSPEQRAKNEAKKKKKAKVDKAAKEEKEAGKKPKKARTVQEWIELVQRLAASAGRALRVVLKGFWVYDVELVLPVEGQDAAEVAIQYGRLQAVVGGARAALENLLHIRYKRLVLIPDFTAESKNQLVFACKIAASPVIMIAAGIVGLAHFIKSSHLLRKIMENRRRRKRIKKRMKELAKNAR